MDARRRSRAASWAIGIGVAACLFAAVFWQASVSAGRHRRVFDEFVQRRRAAGEPTTFAELNPPAPPDAENAAVEIEAALNAVHEQFGPENTWPDVGPWGTSQVGSFEEQSPERVAAQREFSKRFQPFCDRVAKALERPRLRFRVVLGPDGVPDASAGQTLRSTNRILSSEAMVSDDPRRRVDAARSLLLMGKRIEPWNSDRALFGVAMAHSAATAVRIGVERGEVEPAAARRDLDPLLQGDWAAAGPRMLQSAIVSVISTYDAALAARIDDQQFERSMGVPRRVADPSVVVGACELLEEASRMPVAPAAAHRRRLDGMARTKALSTLISFTALLDVMYLDHVEAAMRLARVALAAAEHRATHGDFPASLDELKPMFPDGVPLDPFTDAPFVYEANDSGVRIASAGRLPEDAPLDEATLRERGLVWELKR